MFGFVGSMIPAWDCWFAHHLKTKSSLQKVISSFFWEGRCLKNHYVKKCHHHIEKGFFLWFANQQSQIVTVGSRKKSTEKNIFEGERIRNATFRRFIIKMYNFIYYIIISYNYIISHFYLLIKIPKLYKNSKIGILSPSRDTV